MRIGSGFDVHALDDQPPLKLGGITVDEDRGLAGTSDADVLVHAVCDALLGAAALGDLGTLFPSDDDRWHNADSLDLLARVVAQIEAEGLRVSNVDATVMAQTVRVGPYREQMRTNLARVLHVDLSQVSVKATTTDGLGLVGRDEGIAASAIALLERGHTG